MKRSNGIKTSKTKKRALIISGTIVGAIAIALFIACVPSCDKDNRTDNPNNHIQVEIPDSGVGINDVGDSNNYENMTKEQLIQVIEERDAEIAILEDEVETYKTLAEQTTQAIVPPSRPSNGGGSSSGNDGNTSGGTTSPSDDEPSSGGSSIEDVPSSGGTSTEDKPSSGSSSSDDNPATSDTGL